NRKVFMDFFTILSNAFKGLKSYALAFFFASSSDGTSVDIFNNLLQKSQQFHATLSFPLLANRISAIAGNDQGKQQKIEQQAGNVRLIIHESVMQLIREFLEQDRKS